MNNTKETLSTVRDVTPDIGGNFQLDPAVIESKKRHSYKINNETKMWQNSHKVLVLFKQAATEARSGHGLLEWRLCSMERRRTISSRSCSDHETCIAILTIFQ